MMNELSYRSFYKEGLHGRCRIKQLQTIRLRTKIMDAEGRTETTRNGEGTRKRGRHTGKIWVSSHTTSVDRRDSRSPMVDMNQQRRIKSSHWEPTLSRDSVR